VYFLVLNVLSTYFEAFEDIVDCSQDFLITNRNLIDQ